MTPMSESRISLTDEKDEEKRDLLKIILLHADGPEKRTRPLAKKERGQAESYVGTRAWATTTTPAEEKRPLRGGFKKNKSAAARK